MDILNMSALELSKNIQSGAISVKEAVDAYISVIEEKDKDINAFITIDKEALYKRVDEVQAGIDSGKYVGKLVGVPIAIKDNICTKGITTTCGSKMLENFVPTYNAFVVEKLEEAGLVIIGKTNMDEFAFGCTTEHSAFGATKNPVNKECVPGGSSGGSAAAVAAGMVPLALGSDTGGSVRQPASHCGVVGFKPSYGSVSRYGLVAFASSMDQIGPMGRNVEDVTALYDIIQGYDSKDSTCAKLEYRKKINAVGNEKCCDENILDELKEDISVDLCGNSKEDIDIDVDNITNACEKIFTDKKSIEAARAIFKGKKIGIPEEYFKDGIDEEVKNKVLAVADELKKAGAVVEYFSLKLWEYVVPAYYIIACGEASSNLERFDGVKYGYRSDKYSSLDEMYRISRTQGFGEEVKRRIMLGTFVLSEGYYDDYYLKALKVRNLIKKEFDTAFEKYDMILSPVAPTIAPKLRSLEEYFSEDMKQSGFDTLKMYMSDVYTVAANLCGFPAISVPCGSECKVAKASNEIDMPVGVQFIGKAFDDYKIINMAAAYEILRGEGE